VGDPRTSGENDEAPVSDDAGLFAFRFQEKPMHAHKRTHAPRALQYSARWSNGAWKIFDHARFADVGTATTERLARESVSDMNAGRRK
jgi:hypothetical protein